MSKIKKQNNSKKNQQKNNKKQKQNQKKHQKLSNLTFLTKNLSKKKTKKLWKTKKLLIIKLTQKNSQTKNLTDLKEQDKQMLRLKQLHNN